MRNCIVLFDAGVGSMIGTRSVIGTSVVVVPPDWPGVALNWVDSD